MRLMSIEAVITLLCVHVYKYISQKSHHAWGSTKPALHHTQVEPNYQVLDRACFSPLTLCMTHLPYTTM